MAGVTTSGVVYYGPYEEDYDGMIELRLNENEGILLGREDLLELLALFPQEEQGCPKSSKD